MGSRWTTLTPDDFAALWFSAANDRFPPLLRYNSRFEYKEQYEAHRARVSEGLSDDEMDKIRHAFHTVATGDVRIEILGGRRRGRTGTGDIHEYRVLGVRTAYHAVILVQAAVGGIDGAISILTCRPESLGGTLAKAIPPLNQGQRRPATFHHQDLRSTTDEHFRDAKRESARTEFKRLLRRPIDGGGCAEVFVGTISDRNGAWDSIQWHDVSEDGRYTERHTDDHIEVRPATPQELARNFTLWVEDSEKWLREDRETAWN
ncbi:ESX secretion-associated protein EspG [Nocardia sp. NPDC058666]|uniref:ESX secretion-associated protein EspG n=1 Tax=Nocardia sp. NPDC058666 TaxID=3346587 RepID=UPI0036559521